MRPAFRRGWEGEGKPESMHWSGPAGEARHTGASIPVWEREGEALGVHAQINKQRRSGANGDAQRKTLAPLHGATQADALRAGLWASGRPTSSDTRVPAGQFKNAAPSGARSAGQSASSALPVQLPSLLIVTRMGRDYRPGPRQRIEQVARRAARRTVYPKP